MYTFRPLEAQHAGDNRYRRRAPFRAGWDATGRLLVAELSKIGARNVVLQIDVAPSALRVDGTGPKANAAWGSPVVVVAFDSDHGPLKYVAGEFDHWQDNVRAIALGLEALRKVDRYGITKRGEQYRGWAALPAGGGDDVERGRELIEQHDGVNGALKATHPDHGGDPADFRAVQAARNAAVAL